MSNLSDYLEWRGDLSFEQSPFNKCDALLFSLVSYIDFKEIVPESVSEKIKWSSAAEKLTAISDFEQRKQLGQMINDNTVDIFLKASRYPRFNNLFISKYEAILDEEKKEQFSAVTIDVGKTACVVFRGTDDTLVGWHEDFNLVNLDAIPSQVDADRYFSEVCAYQKKSRGNIVIIGHSKGGHLAVDTAKRAEKSYKKLIQDVYNFDGPGFPKEYFEQREYLAVAPKIHSFYPEFSIVGMIFEHTDGYEIVKSSELAVMQHDPLSWQIKAASFENADSFRDESIFFYNALNGWIARLDTEQRKSLVESLFSVLYASGAKTNTDLDHDKLSNMRRMLSAYMELDSDTKVEIHKIIMLLKQSVKVTLPMFNLFSFAD